ncbi:MAG TPA: FAD-dependent oxidoreductase [Microvirga sp.]|jgi:selenide,water dikinase|nr:FAD-dependent oxidoreductase [Microvirga sp.]
MSANPARKRLVLVGGGHAHALVLRDLVRRPEPDVAVTLVTRDVATPYSGMLPGHVAGFYPREAMHIDLARLAESGGIRLVHGEAVGFDRAGRQVRLAGGAAVSFDVLSIDIGIAPDLSGIAGAAEHALGVKPIGDFLEKWDGLKARALGPGGPRGFAVIGGGAAGLCLVFAVAATLRREAAGRGLDPSRFAFHLVSAAAPPELNPGMRRAALRALERHGIGLHRGAAASVDPAGVTLADGRRIAADAVLVSTQGAPPAAFRGSGFATDARGFLALRPTLEVEGETGVFAAGDCATVLAHPRPKAGVYAVRQGKPLARNLRLSLRGEAPEPFVPQARHLVILSTADGRAIAGRGDRLAYEGRAAWWLKDRIDRGFMRLFD